MSGDSKKRVAVVGAGIAGLVAACKLSQEGSDVVVFEKDHSAGGRAKTIVKDGFHLNLGAHALYMGGATYQFLAANGIVISGSQPKLNSSFAIYDRSLYSLPVSLGGLLTSGYLQLGDKIELSLVMGRLPKLDLPKLMSVSLFDWLKINVKNRRVKQTLESFVRLSTYGNNPQQLAAGQAFRQLLLAQQGVLYLDHGWQTIVDALQTKISGKVDFRFNAAIEAIHPQQSQQDGVDIFFNGARDHFDAVFLCVPPDDASKLVPTFTPLSFAPSRMACLDVCLRRLPDSRRTFALGIDEPLYFSVHSAVAKLAPENGATIHLGYYLNDKDYMENHEERLLALLDQMQPGWRDELVYKRYLPHMVASFGLPLASLDGASGMPGPNLSQQPNIFVCGDYVGNGGQLADCSASSALKAVELFQRSAPVAALA